MVPYLTFNSTANRIDSHAFEPAIVTKINEMLTGGNRFIDVVFAQGGGYVVLFSENQYLTSGITAADLDLFTYFKAFGAITNLVCGPKGGWLFVGDKGNWPAPGFPADVAAQVRSIAGANRLLNVVFAPNGSHVIICENNRWRASDNFPAELSASIKGFIDAGCALTNVIFFPNGSALIMGTNGDYLPAGSAFPTEVLDALKPYAGTQGQKVGTHPIVKGSQLGALVIGPTRGTDK